ncbi:unknown protein [Seminavis robusta]|uniref:SAM domain-containing protein n=1 Tax=Seminavis robusta TaxID=568900 RepID=A0A9N8HKW8_9STRA|nr:unknown protein [Seminavis robusta]|eukprot:Sro642_g180170.1 n/a (387) ;mRNA; r:29262-30422
MRKRNKSVATTPKPTLEEGPDDVNILNKLQDIESGKCVVEGWNNPIPRYQSTVGKMRMLFAPLDPVFSQSGDWVLAAEPSDIAHMYQAYMRVLMIYYTFVGVTALRLTLESPYYPDNMATRVLSLIARCCWSAECLWCIGAVVGIFHSLWAVFSVPAKDRRRFVLDNPTAMSFVYTYGALSFCLFVIGVVTGAMAYSLQDKFPHEVAIATVIGLFVSLIAMSAYIYHAGSLMANAMRPWRVAYEQAKKELEVGREAPHDYHRYLEHKRASMRNLGEEDQEQQLSAQETQDEYALTNHNMQEHAAKLRSAGLVLPELAKLRNPTLADQLLQSAGVKLPGHRLKILLLLQELCPLEDDASTVYALSQQLSIVEENEKDYTGVDIDPDL